MVEWQVEFTKKAQRDSQLLKAANLDKKAQRIINEMKEDPYRIPPPFEKLKADLSGKFSRRINIKHRIVYEIMPSENLVLVYGMFSHYGE